MLFCYFNWHYEYSKNNNKNNTKIESCFNIFILIYNYNIIIKNNYKYPYSK